MLKDKFWMYVLFGLF